MPRLRSRPSNIKMIKTQKCQLAESAIANHNAFEKASVASYINCCPDVANYPAVGAFPIST
jgi:hypothetical protein